MKKWKYLVLGVSSPGVAQEMINDAGAEGWELVSVVPVFKTEGLTIFLKKPETE
ncbi:MAG: DUF4177 domain-containing protein [Terriglobia bacterium]